MTIQIRSTAFDAGSRIPRQYTGEGPDLSPPLAWVNVPEKARELALICDDPDAPVAEPWVHWVLYGLDPKLRELPSNDDGGGREGVNDFHRAGYGGPMPPPGHGTHHYHFKLYALDTRLDLKPGATKKQLLEAMKGHVLEEGELVGTYER
jgi:Raf kinase inhibitor-like YbhB/YbcL family protein